MEHFGQYGEDELRLIFDFVENGIGFLMDETARLRGLDLADLDE